MTEVENLLIGEFARRCRLPVSTLRYYDRIGLLTPADVDGANGYRRYRADQLAAAELIARLRSLGVAPQQIAEILDGGETASTALLRERRRVSKELARSRRRLAEFDDLLADAGPAPYLVTTTLLTERQVVARDFVAPFEEQEQVILRAIGELRTEIRGKGRVRVGPWGATLPLDLDDTVAGCVFAPVDDCEGMRAEHLPAGPAVTTVHPGALDSLSVAYLALFSEIERLGAKPQAPVIEEYLSLEETRAAFPRATAPRVRLTIRFTD